MQNKKKWATPMKYPASSHDYSYAYDNMTAEHMHEKMARGWKGSNVCGHGSEPDAVKNFLHEFPILCAKYDIHTAANVGAGTLSWWTDPEGVEVDHFDLIVRHEKVQEFDAVTEILPMTYDVIVCRYVMNHISAAFAQRMLDNFKASGARYLLHTLFDNHQKYWIEHNMYPLPGKVLETFADDESSPKAARKMKRCELVEL